MDISEMMGMMDRMKTGHFSFWMQIDEEGGNELLGLFRECAFLSQQGWSDAAVADVSKYMTALLDGVTTTSAGDETLFHVTSEAQGGKKMNDCATILSTLLGHNSIKYRIEIRDSADGEPTTTYGDFEPPR